MRVGHIDARLACGRNRQGQALELDRKFYLLDVALGFDFQAARGVYAIQVTVQLKPSRVLAQPRPKSGAQLSEFLALAFVIAQ